MKSRVAYDPRGETDLFTNTQGEVLASDKDILVDILHPANAAPLLRRTCNLARQSATIEIGCGRTASAA